MSSVGGSCGFDRLSSLGWLHGDRPPYGTSRTKSELDVDGTHLWTCRLVCTDVKFVCKTHGFSPNLTLRGPCIVIYRCPGGNVTGLGRMFLTLKYTDITQNTYIRSWTVTDIMAREKRGLLVVPRTVPVSRVVTRTLRMSALQSHSRVKHIPPCLSTDVTVTVNCNSILLDIHVPCKVFGTLRTTTTLVRVYVV